LKLMRSALAPGDQFLLGANLVKAASRPVRPMTTVPGVTAEFNPNLIEVLRTEPDAEGLYVDDIQHIARQNPLKHRIEMWLGARRDVAAQFRALNRDWKLAAGTKMLTEISVISAYHNCRLNWVSMVRTKSCPTVLRVLGRRTAEIWCPPAGTQMSVSKDFSVSASTALGQAGSRTSADLHRPQRRLLPHAARAG
jgi:hypothetical protein